jgi:hypothetical protein
MQILRLRFLDQAHNFVTFGRENDKSIFWADIYNGNQGFVVYGHQIGNVIQILAILQATVQNSNFPKLHKQRHILQIIYIQSV